MAVISSGRRRPRLPIDGLLPTKGLTMLLRSLFRSEVTRMLLLGFALGSVGVAINGAHHSVAHPHSVVQTR